MKNSPPPPHIETTLENLRASALRIRSLSRQTEQVLRKVQTEIQRLHKLVQALQGASGKQNPRQRKL